jgi:hypothetical protein
MANIVDRMAQSVKGHGVMMVRRLWLNAVNKQLKKSQIRGSRSIPIHRRSRMGDRKSPTSSDKAFLAACPAPSCPRYNLRL